MSQACILPSPVQESVISPKSPGSFYQAPGIQCAASLWLHWCELGILAEELSSRGNPQITFPLKEESKQKKKSK